MLCMWESQGENGYNVQETEIQRKGVMILLTPKQEKFVRNLVKGMSQREAYKNSYDAENMTDKTIDEKACILFADDKIRARYNELIERATTASVMTAQERLEFLTEVIMDLQREKRIKVTDDGTVEYEEPADINTKLKAVDLMNKMQGEYTTKIEGELKVSKLEDLI